MPTTGRPAITIYKVHMTNMRTVGTQSFSDTGFLNIHMEQVRQNYDVISIQCTKKRNHVFCPVQEITLITV